MPMKSETYHLVPYQKGWRVMSNNGTFFSNKALTLTRAKAQQRALYAAKRRGDIFHGGSYTFLKEGGRSHLILKGQGFLGDAFARLKSMTSAVATRVKSVVKGIRNDFNPPSREILMKYGSLPITTIRIRREPIQSFINKALDFITRGEWSKAKQELNYDKLFHLSLMLTLQQPDGSTNEVILEKNAVVNLSDSYNANAKQQFMMVPWTPDGTTLAQFVERGRAAMGASFFPYSAFKDNCQAFVLGLLRANGLSSPQVESFVLQNVDSLLKRLPAYSSPVANVVTNIAGLADVAMYGEGKEKWIQEATEDMKKGAFTKQAKRAKMTPEAFADHVLANPSKFKMVTRKRAMFVKNVTKGGMMPSSGSKNIPSCLKLSVERGAGKTHLNMFELFKGTGSVGKVAKRMGYNVISLDFDPIYTPDIETDILKWDYKKWADENNFIPDYIWASPPCNTYSILAYPLKERNIKTAEPKSARAKEGTAILHRTLDIIKYFQSKNPKMLYTIENPRGMMRHDKEIKKLPNRETTLYCLYGDFKRKPTDFWSNFPIGLKSHTEKCNRKTIPVEDLRRIEQRYSIPSKLVRKILTEAKEQYGDTKGGMMPYTKHLEKQVKKAVIRGIATDKMKEADKPAVKADEEVKMLMDPEAAAEARKKAVGRKLVFGSGPKVITMKPADFFAEHKKLVHLLNSIGDTLKAEAADQAKEAGGWKKKLSAGAVHSYGGVRLRGIRMNDSDSESDSDSDSDSGIFCEGGCACGGGIQRSFKAYLEKRKISPEKYLEEARRAAKRTGYDPRALEFSDDAEHKLMIYDDEGHVRRFGRVGYGDFLIHSATASQQFANSKRDRFRKSHMKIKGDWKKDKFSPNWLAINILW